MKLLEVHNALVGKLVTELNVKKEQAIILKDGLYEALASHQNMKGLYDPQISVSNYRDEIVKISKGLKNVNAALARLPHHNRHTLDSLYYEANDRDSLMMNVNVGELPEGDGLQSGYETITLKLQKTIELTLENIPLPGKGGGGVRGKIYIAGIEALAKSFVKACPNNKLSSAEKSKFYKYVSIWLSVVLKISTKNTKNHIQNALSHDHIRELGGALKGKNYL